MTDPLGDKTNRWRLCTVTQVEEFKSFIRILPVWAATVALALSFAQFSTFFVSQASILLRQRPRPRPSLREAHHPRPPQPHRPPPRHHLAAAHGRRALRLHLRHRRRRDHRETTPQRPDAVGSQRVLALPSVLPDRKRRGVHVRRTAGVLLRRGHRRHEEHQQRHVLERARDRELGEHGDREDDRAVQQRRGERVAEE